MPGYRRGTGPRANRPTGASGGTRTEQPEVAPERVRRAEPPTRRPPSRRFEETEDTTRLAALCGEAFSLILQLRDADDLPPASHLEHEISGILERIARSAANAGIPAADVEHARYALAAFIDETILNHSSAVKDQWLVTPLQMRYFNENTAGEGFFARLEQLRRGRGRSEALEVYFLCLVLGFEGRYRLSPGGELGKLIQELQRDVAEGEPAGGALSPHGERPDAAAAPAGRHLPLLAIAGGFVALVIVVLVVLGYTTGSSAHTKGTRIRDLANALEASER